MTFALDDDCSWEQTWLIENPEPFPEPTFRDNNGNLGWRPYEVLERIKWHQRRWEAFKVAFPNWHVINY